MAIFEMGIPKPRFARELVPARGAGKKTRPGVAYTPAALDDCVAGIFGMAAMRRRVYWC